ncbi:MAG: VOC family protein, partial [Betaproteobacteria bacterium]
MQHGFRKRFVRAQQQCDEQSPDSAIAKFVERRGPGLHHITLRVDDIRAALTQLRERHITLIDEEPRIGAEGAIVAFIHPSSAQGVLVELKQMVRVADQSRMPTTIQLGDIQLTLLLDGFFHLDG